LYSKFGHDVGNQILVVILILILILILCIAPFEKQGLRGHFKLNVEPVLIPCKIRGVMVE